MRKPHRFAVGQQVEVAAGRMAQGGPRRDYTVVRLLPIDGPDRNYVLRGKAESHDRVVPESMIQERPLGLAQKVFA